MIQEIEIKQYKERLYDKPTLFTKKQQDNKVKCLCGHSVEFWHGDYRTLCTWCNRFVYKDKKREFIDKMKGLIK